MGHGQGYDDYCNCGCETERECPKRVQDMKHTMVLAMSERRYGHKVWDLTPYSNTEDSQQYPLGEWRIFVRGCSDFRFGCSWDGTCSYRILSSGEITEDGTLLNLPAEIESDEIMYLALFDWGCINNEPVINDRDDLFGYWEGYVMKYIYGCPIIADSDRRGGYLGCASTVELFELINDTRVNPQNVMDRYFTSISPLVAINPTIQRACNDYNVNGAQLKAFWDSQPSRPPLDWDSDLAYVSTMHNEVMNGQTKQGVELPGEGSVQSRCTAAGFDGTATNDSCAVYAYSLEEAETGFSPVFFSVAAYCIGWGEANNRTARAILSDGTHIGACQLYNPYSLPTGPYYHTVIVGTRNTPQLAMPSLFRQVANFTSSATRHVVTGLQKADPIELDRRRAICGSCEYFAKGRCSVCGCYTGTKTSWAEQHCPIEKW